MERDQLNFALAQETADEENECLFDPRQIRAEAKALIAEARSAGADGPWDAEAVSFKKLIFPHLVSWLPSPAERSQLCFEFYQELDRIEALLAA